MRKTTYSQNTKPTWLLVLILSCLFSFQSLAQSNDKTFTVVINNKPFSEAIEQIEKTTGYTFSYATADVNATAKVSLNVTKGDIRKITNALLKGQNLNYEIVNTHIILTKKGAKAKQSSTGSGSKRTITGQVLDSNGEPLIGAVVRIKGTDVAVLTDIDGNYSLITDSDEAPRLDVSYIGFESKEAVAHAEKLNFSLAEDKAQELEDVVVTGYNVIKKESLTAAISSVGAEDLARTSAVNTSGALAGKVAGLNFRQANGRPNSYTSISIRNMGTPLYVVDGVQMDEGQFNNIDFNDIVSISVLKDASASIYGVRAANGVVVVTTKMGKRNQKCRINFNAYYGWQSMFRFPELTTASSYVRDVVQAQTLNGVTPTYTQEEYQKWQDGTEPGYQNFDWKEYIWRKTAPQTYAEVSASGGSEKMSYYLALSNTRQEAMAKDYGQFQRTNIQLNVEANITDNFKVKAQINGRVENNEQAAYDSGMSGTTGYWALAYATVNNPPIKTPYANNNPVYPSVVTAAGYTNYAILTREMAGLQNDNWRVLQANLTGEWEPLKGLTFKGLFSYFNSNERYKSRYNGYKLYSYNQGSDTYTVAKEQSGRYWNRWQYIEMLNSQLSVNFKHSWNNTHFLDVFGGFEAYKHNNPGVNYTGVPTMNALKISYFDELTGLSDYNENTQARLGWMGKINYEYKHRYLLDIAARYDGSWKFPPSHRWGFFPSASAAWRISEEPFWQNSVMAKYVDNLKLRVSYGLTGDDNVGGYSAYGYMSGYNYNTGSTVLDGTTVVGSSVRSLPQTNVTWLKAKTFDVGLDVTVLNGRLSGSIDYFQRLREGLLASRYDVVVPNEIGFSWPTENLNSDMIKGFDAQLTWEDNIQDFQYSVGGTVTLARAYNWEQYKPTFGNSRDYYVYNSHHRYVGASWGFECIGQFESWEEIAAYPVDIDGKGNSTLRPGDLILEDTNGDNIITNADQKPIGNTAYPSASDYGELDTRTPLLNFGLNISAAWKGFDFAADFAGSACFTHVFNYEARFPFWGDSDAFAYMSNDQWHLADPFDADSELIPGKYPTMRYGANSHSNYYFSSFWMKNVWYLKLRNLQFGYTLPTSLTRKAYIEKLRVYVMAQNLFSIDNVHGYGLDPEVSNVTGTSYPTTRIVNIGFNLTF